MIDYVDNGFIVPACNGKLQRIAASQTYITIVTIQAGCFPSKPNNKAVPQIKTIEVETGKGTFEFVGYETVAKGDVDLGKADVIVGAGRGIGSKENIELIQRLAEALGGAVGASRPIVDAGWLPYELQIGATGQIVSPKLYFACGISGAIQHTIGIMKSEFIVAINSDKEAPIGEKADVLVSADLKQFLPILIDKLKKYAE